jgi:hypothetical protein
MKRGLNPVLWITGGTLALCFAIGAGQDVGQNISVQPDQPAQQSQSPGVAVDSSATLPTAPPSARIVKVQGPPSVPVECLDYLSEVDTVVKAVYDYENGIQPANDAFTKGLMALVQSDANQLNEAHTELNKVQNNTAGPLAAIVQGSTELTTAQKACHKALGGH